MSLRKTFDEASLATIGTLASRSIFDEKVREYEQDTFLTSLLDRNDPIQRELGFKLDNIVESRGLQAPETYEIQMYGRKAGYKYFMPPAPYSACIGVVSFQTVRHNNTDFVIEEADITPVFTLSTKCTPRIPFNNTKVTLPSGKTTIKTQGYLSMVAWAHWSESPEPE